MIAVLGGLGASICFAISALCSAAASRRIGAASTLSWVMTIGLVFVVPAVLIAGTSQLSAGRIALLAIAGLTNVVGLLFEYVAFRRGGKIGVITPIVSSEGAIATVIAVIAGLEVFRPRGRAVARRDGGSHPRHSAPRSTCGLKGHDTSPLGPSWPFRARSCSGISLYVTARVGREVPVVWVLLPGRLLGTVLLTAPLAARHELRPPSSAWPLVLATALAEVIGIASYTLGARHQIAIAAVIASQFAALAAVGAYFVFDERLTKLQLAGLVVVLTGVGLLAAEGT